jgi:predicted DNA-binding transcriptional regulator AlpA
MAEDNGKGQTLSVALRHYRIKQVAELLAVSVREVWRLVARGELAAPLKIGRCSVWTESDIINLQTRLQLQREGRSV